MRIVSSVMAIALLATMASTQVHATSNHGYKKHEYPVIGGGRAPNGRLAIAAHGEGDDGYDDFHLYLRASRRIVQSLPAIESKDILDTSPEAYDAAWSPDSRRVAITFRNSRHTLDLRLYDLRGRHLHRVIAPDPVDRFIKKANTDPDDLRTRLITVSWLGPTRFRLKQQNSYKVPSRDLARALGAFGREEIDNNEQTTDSDGKSVTWSVVNTSMDVIYEIRKDHRLRIVSMKPGAFD